MYSGANSENDNNDKKSRQTRTAVHQLIRCLQTEHFSVKLYACKYTKSPQLPARGKLQIMPELLNSGRILIHPSVLFCEGWLFEGGIFIYILSSISIIPNLYPVSVLFIPKSLFHLELTYYNHVTFKTFKYFPSTHMTCK